MFQITDVRCEYFRNPIGIDVQQPRISWKLKSENRDVKQSAYQIQVASDPQFNTVLFDSERVESDQNIHIALTEIEIKPRTRYYYRIRAWNQQGECSSWSPVAYWESGLMHFSAWQGKWISAPKELDLSERCPMLRRLFRLEQTVQSARVYVTALGLYELRLNGQRVGDAYFTPGWTSYHHRLQYQTYDVTHLLQPGENVIGALLGNGWYKGYLGWKGKKELYGDRRALLMQMHIKFENGQEFILVSDENWKVTGSPILRSEIYHGENYDARLEQPGWDMPKFEDSCWQSVEVLPYSKQMIIAQENEPVRKVNEIKPVKLITTPNGETVIDMGQNMVGWVRFTVEGKAGQEVTIQHAEVLDKEGNFYTENLRSAEQTVRYTLKGTGKETFEPHFTFQGFRYIKLKGLNVENICLEDFTGVVLHSDMDLTGQFECSDPLINQLQHNILWGMKGNFLDIPTDCPQRDERLGWTGDAQIFIRTAAFLMNVAPFFTKWLKDLASDQAEDGGVPFVVPNILTAEDAPKFGHPFNSAAWGDAAVICPWTIYICYGDQRILEQQYESMKAWVEYIRRQGDNEYLWNTGFHFGDWLGLDAQQDSYVGATDRDLIATAFYAYSVSLLRKTATVLNKVEDIEEYGRLYQNIVLAFREEFVTPSGRLAAPTQTAHVLALVFDLLDTHSRERAARKLLSLLEENNYHLTTGFVGTPYLNHALSLTGNHEAAYKLLFQKDFPSWLYQVTKGATTVWEHWDGIKEDGSFWSRNMNSFNHYAYGAIGDWIYRHVVGINLDETEPAYKKIIIRPQLNDRLEWAQGQLETMYGTVRSSWKKNGKKVDLEIEIPVNTSAQVWIPHTLATEVKESGQPISMADGIKEIKETEQGIIIEIGSGRYHFEYQIMKK